MAQISSLLEVIEAQKAMLKSQDEEIGKLQI